MILAHTAGPIDRILIPDLEHLEAREKKEKKWKNDDHYNVRCFFTKKLLKVQCTINITVNFGYYRLQKKDVYSVDTPYFVCRIHHGQFAPCGRILPIPWCPALWFSFFLCLLISVCSFFAASALLALFSRRFLFRSCTIQRRVGSIAISRNFASAPVVS